MSNRIARRVLVPVSNPLGGIRTYLLYNLRSLSESGYEFTFLAPQGHAFDEFKNDVRDWPGVAFIDVPVDKRTFSLRKSIRRALKKDHFALVHSQGMRAGAESAMAMLGLRVPHAITLHDTINPHNRIPGRFRWLKARAAGWLTSRADAVVAVSQDCADNYLSHFPEWKRGRCQVVVIPNGVDVASLIGAQKENGTPQASLRQELGIDENVVMAGFFGRFMPEKGFLVLLEALRDLARRGLVDRLRLVATRDPHGFRGEYVREVTNDAVLSRVVHFVEPVPAIGPLLAQMDLLITPSLWEACPLLPMEAMVLGVPVVGSNAVGLREVLRDTPSSMPETGDHRALSHAIEDALRPSHKQDSLLFIPQARTRFSNKLALDSLRSLYDQLCCRFASAASAPLTIP